MFFLTHSDFLCGDNTAFIQTSGALDKHVQHSRQHCQSFDLPPVSSLNCFCSSFSDIFFLCVFSCFFFFSFNFLPTSLLNLSAHSCGTVYSRLDSHAKFVIWRPTAICTSVNPVVKWDLAPTALKTLASEIGDVNVQVEAHCFTLNSQCMMDSAEAYIDIQQRVCGSLITETSTFSLFFFFFCSDWHKTMLILGSAVSWEAGHHAPTSLTLCTI